MYSDFCKVIPDPVTQGAAPPAPARQPAVLMRRTGRLAWVAALLALALLLGVSQRAQAQTVTSIDSPADIGDSESNAICGTGLDNADYLLFNGKYKAILYEYGDYDTGCWYFTVPIVSPPTAVNGPAVVVLKNGTQVAAGNFEVGSDIYDDNVFLTRLANGYYLVMDGPYLGTATSVSLDGALAQFQTSGPYRVLIRLPEEIQALASLPYATYTFDVVITTPYGDYEESGLEAGGDDYVGVINLIPPGSPGSFAVYDVNEDTTPNGTVGTYRTPNGATAGYEEFLSSYDLYLDYGQSSAGPLYDYVTTAPELSAPNTLSASGQFTGSGGNPIDFTVTSWLEPYDQQYYMSAAFTATTGTLGTLKLRPRMDEDVWDLNTDMSAFIGDSATAANFAVMTPDKTARVGYGLKGFYTPSPGRLTNATYEGFATSYYSDLEDWIVDRTLVFSTTFLTGEVPPNTIDTVGCLTEQAEAGWLTGKVYLDQSDCDVGVAMSWVADPNATNAVITHMLYNVAGDPTVASTDASLAGIEVTADGSPVSLAPAPFVSATLAYTAAAELNANTAIFTPTLSDSQAMVATVKVTYADGSSAACSSSPFACPLRGGSNRVEVVVLSGDFTRQQAYSFSLTTPCAKVVTTDANSGPGSLREQVASVCTGSIVTFDASFNTPRTIVLSGMIPIQRSVIISGTGAANVIVSGDGANRVFGVAAGAVVTLKGLTVTGGSSDSAGGGIYVAGDDAGSLTLDAVHVISNTASDYGGGLYIDGDVPVTLTNSLFESNSSDEGGAIYAAGDAALPLVIRDTDFLSNTVVDYGGAIYLYEYSQLAIEGGRFSGNSADYGGAICSEEGSVSIDVVGAQFSGNTAVSYGGGIYSEGPLTLSHVTLDGNQVTESSYGGGYGGALYLYDSAALLNADQITVTNNVAVEGYGGGLSIAGDVPVTLTNSLFEGNSSTEGSSGQGGAIYAAGDEVLPLVIQDTDFLSNTVVDYGGAIYLYEYTQLTIKGGRFSGNSAEYGGAICSDDGSVSIDVVGARFSGNTAGYYGGGIYAEGPLTLSHVTLDGNQVTESGYDGGALYVYNSDALLNADQITVTNNVAVEGYGGGVYIDGDVPVTLTNSLFEGNSSTEGGALYLDSAALLNADQITVTNNVAVDGYGGGLYIHGDGPVTLTNSLFEGNSSLFAGTSGQGGAIYAGGDAALPLVIRDTDFLSNTVVDYGGAIYLYEYTQLRIEGGRFSGNSADYGGAICSDDGSVSIDVVGAQFSGNTAGYYGGAIYVEGPLTLSHVTLDGNQVTESDYDGGALYLYSDALLNADQITVTNNVAVEGYGGGLYIDGDVPVTLTNSLFEGNTSADGGAIYAAGNEVLPLAIRDTDFLSNTADNDGGAIYLYEYTQFDVQGGSFRSNQSANAGGAINVYDSSSEAAVAETLFEENVSEGDGGAVYAGGPVALTQVTLSGNQAGGQGGGVYSTDSTALVNSTLYANEAMTGGALYNGGVLDVQFSTLSGNQAAVGGGIYDDGNGEPLVADSIVANSGVGAGSLNAASAGGDLAGGAFDNGAATVRNVLSGTVALGPLQDNGGSTPTMALVGSSPAIDAAVCGSVTVDQRGASRPQGAACDIGAYEADNTALAGLAIAPGVLSPAFLSTTLEYTALVPFSAASTVVTATPDAGGAVTVTIQVAANGSTPAACTVTPVSCPLAVGENVITITVTAADGTTQSYTVTVMRAGDATLGGLQVSPGALSPGFISSTLNYTTATLSHAVASMLVTPTVAYPSDTVSIEVAANGGSAAACTGDPVDCPLAVGENVITVTVTALDGTTRSYTVTVVRASDATLGGLQVSPGALAPGFISSTLHYTTAAVSHATAALLVTPTVPYPSDAVSIEVAPNGGAATACTGDPVSCPLAVGTNVVTTTVTAADGSTRSYTVTVVRAGDATLGGLEVSPGSLVPGFVSSTLNYTTEVSYAVPSMLLTPTVTYPSDVVSVEVAANGGAPAACTGNPVDCPLAVGTNIITTTVTAADGTTRSYTVTVTRAAPSSDASLGGLVLNDSTGVVPLSPAFDPAVTDYTASVANSESSVTVVAQANDPGASVTSVTVAANGGAPAACTGDPLSCPLAVGTNVITTTVTAEDGTTKTYTVTITRAASSDASLSGLALNDIVGAVPLAPAFDGSITAYTASVGNGESSVTVMAEPNDIGASVTSVTVAQNGGAPIACTTNPLTCPLAVGTNVITITVTAADGTTRGYTVTVTRAAPDSDASLSSLVLIHASTQIPLAPAFASSVTDYMASVGSAVDSAAVQALASAPGAAITAVAAAANGGAPVACTGDPLSCPLAVGTNVITVTVTAADGTTRTYTVIVERAAPDSSDASLSGLALNDSVGAVPLAPAFDGSITSYTASVGNGESSVTVMAEPNDIGASVTSVTVAQNGGALVACTTNPLTCPLAVGTNVITVTVMAADGTTQSYTITVTRDAPVVSSDATLGSLAIDPGALSPAFDAGITEYSAEVGSAVDAVSVTAAANDFGASVTSVTVAANGGAPVACPTNPLTCPLAVGANVITVTVTAADGTTKTYTITIVRAAPSAVVAVNDAAGVLEGESVAIAPLANDRDPAGGGLLVLAVTDPANGTAVIAGDGRTVTYTPDAGFQGLDNFRYTAQDANGATSEAVISVVVTAKGDGAAPQVAPVDPTTTTTATFTTANGSVTIVVPSGAYDGSQGPLGPTDIFYIAFTEILTPTSNIETPPGTLSFGGKIFTLEAFFNAIQLDNYVFPQPVTFTIGYNPAQVNDLLPETLELFYWDVDTLQWSQAGLTFVSRDTVNHTITYQVAHFTEFAYFGDDGIDSLYLPLVHKVSLAYSSNFAAGVTDKWTPQQLTTAPDGRRFLGEFANDTATLSLGGLEPHSRVTVSFDLHVIRSWDGDQTSVPPGFDPYAHLELAATQAIGPDRFLVRAGGETLFDATFSNWGQFTQSFPVAGAPAHSGALATNSLGYRFSRLDLPLDATYRITLSFAHSDPSLALDFSGAGLQGVEDESWGIDNVTVTLH